MKAPQLPGKYEVKSEIIINASTAEVWDVLKDFGNAAKELADDTSHTGESDSFLFDADNIDSQNQPGLNVRGIEHIRVFLIFLLKKIKSLVKDHPFHRVLILIYLVKFPFHMDETLILILVVV